MRVKKYNAPTMAEAMEKVRDELGRDAVILHSKKVEKGGLLGFFTKKSMEVVAAVDPETPVTETQVKKKALKKVPQKSNREQEVMRQELRELKSLTSANSSGPRTVLSGGPEKAEERLFELEIEEPLRSEILHALLKRWYREEEPEESSLDSWLEEEIQKRIPETPDLSGRKFINVFGPTGVGKTTTLAKIAAKAVVQEGKKVGFITTDTFRIAAIEQLKTYADILDVPVKVAYSMEDFEAAKAAYEDFDLVLIDSAGRNFRNPLYVEQLKELIDLENEVENYLVLSVTSKYRDMKKIIEQFELIRVDAFVFTKFDETETSGVVLNAVNEYQIPVRYITVGQNVPDDIRPADRAEVAALITGRKSVQ
ncbi:flagellar biosynthesis protein FlhF [Alkalicoccus urumqiensis]|uniref:Flagellar biosynthesis protein FlhF n=1 Tax=Alkalicoccus urumqiensis TaxID=1548213 RepID=A0A2P6MFY7_ALKUR|nr:flagellar biosynthesis protein FlhF [Alkalicoccus urumqiensis]PRO65212.1 flagellar biosynthesis protein FlhF [Alkalicoccus urumqiensis]